MIKVVFVDIDNTLLSFDGYVRETMKKGFSEFGLPKFEGWMYDAFQKVNHGLWRKIEQGLRYSISRDPRQSTEHKHVHDRREYRLDKEPQRPEDRLLVNSHDVALDIHVPQIAIPPKVFKIDIQKPFLRFYDKCPFLLHVSPRYL